MGRGPDQSQTTSELSWRCQTYSVWGLLQDLAILYVKVQIVQQKHVRIFVSVRRRQSQSENNQKDPLGLVHTKVGHKLQGEPRAEAARLRVQGFVES